MPAGTSTALRAQAKDPQRVNVFINHEFALGVSLNTITKEGLFVGKTLDEEAYARLELTESSDRAMQAAMRLLEVRPRATAELRDRLRRKEFSDEAIDRVIERLTALGLLDDAAFAKLWVSHRQSSQPRGISALRDELRRKGLDKDVVEATLSNAELTEGEDERAMQVARGALRKYANAPNRQAFQRRIGSYLQRRGYSFATIAPIIDTLWNELQQGAAENDETEDEA